MSKVIEINKENIELLNVIYDAITKHENAGGIAGLRKITKILDKIDEFADLQQKDSNGNPLDQYKLKDENKTYNFFLDDSEVTDIKAWFDQVKWHPLKARHIVKAFDLLESAKEVKLEVEKK